MSRVLVTLQTLRKVIEVSGSDEVQNLIANEVRQIPHVGGRERAPGEPFGTEDRVAKSFTAPPAPDHQLLSAEQRAELDAYVPNKNAAVEGWDEDEET